MTKWDELKKDPFGYVDRISLVWHGKDFNIFHDDAGIRKVALGFALVCLALWVIMGFDSSPLQFVEVLYNLPSVLLGHRTLSSLTSLYNSFYGKEMHYSAFVIYVLLYWGLSRNWARVGVAKTKNVIYSFGAMFLAIGLFEWYWIGCFGVFQHQPWVYTWKMPQLRILFQNLSFTVAGGLAAFYMWVDSYVIENHMIIGRLWMFPWRSWKLWLVLALGAASAILWIYCPGQCSSSLSP